MIAIRVDANEYIASGHVMRCLSIADALFSLGEDVVFITADDNAKQIIDKRGFNTVILNSDWSDKEGELDLLITEIEKLKPGLLLIDSYQVTERYLTELHRKVKTAYIDDLNAFDYPTDIVINYSIYAGELNYPKNKLYLLGTSYTPLRAQFNISEHQYEEAAQKRKNHKQILITTGAADPHHVSEKVIAAILNEHALNEYDLAVIEGGFWDKVQFNAFIEDSINHERSNRIEAYSNIENMADLMINSTLAVSAGGSTLYELCACRVPTVTFSYADNQLGNVKGFAKRDIMPYAGDARVNSSIGADIVQNLLKFHKNFDIMVSVRERMLNLGCRNGAMNLAEALLSYIRK